MIWFTLALFTISFLVVALLTPKPKIENARPDSLDNIDFPRATEDAPIPLILGKVRMKAPNTIWYGDFKSVPIKEKIKTGLFSSKRVTVGHRYFLGLDLALGMGPNTILREIYIDDKSAWTGTAGPGKSNVNGIFLSFGGYKNGGSFKSDAIYYSGETDLISQPVDSYVESQVGVGNVPAYLGTAHIVFPSAEIGETAQLRKMAFILENYTNSLGLPNNGKIGEDLNPAEAIYQIMTNNWRGMGVDPAYIDTTSLFDIGNTLYDEGNGVSVCVTAENTGSSLIQEILRQIDGVAYQDPDTGLIKFKLIRNDYDIDTIPEFDENDVISIQNFSRTSWDEVVAQVKVSYAARDSDSSRVAVSQDMATANMIGRLRSTTISMPLCYDSSLANKIASRERAQLSIPLFRMTIEFNRNANKLRPGDVFKLNWSEYGLSDVILRVQEFDFGELAKGRIVVKCLQDKFAVDKVVIADPSSSSWVPPVVDPQDITIASIIEMPRFFMKKLEFPLQDGKVGIIPLPVSPGGASSGFDLLAGTTSGDLSVREPEGVEYPPTGTLIAQYDKEAGFASGRDTVGFTITNVKGTFEPASSTADARTGESGLLYVNGEWMTFETIVNNGNGTYTLSNIQRGLLGSMPKTHPIGTRVFQVKPALFGEGTLDDLYENDILYYKLLDRVGAVSREEDEVSESTFTTTDLADRPVRPRYLEIDNQRTGIVISDFEDKSLTWRPSNREATQITFEDDPDEIPDQTETYDVEVYVDGSLEPALSQTNVSSPFPLKFSLTSIMSTDAEARVKSRRTVGNLRSSASYGWIKFEMNQSSIEDPFWDNVVFISGFEGSDNGTTFYNEKTLSSISAFGTPKTLIVAKKKGNTGLAVNEDGGSGDYLSLGNPSSAGTDFLTGDFTIEGWAKSTSNSSSWYHSVLGNFVNTDTGSWSVFLTNNNSNRVSFIVDDGPSLFCTTDLDTEWFHFAVSRNGSTLRIFVNGVMEAKSTTYTTSVSGTQNVKIGGNNAGSGDDWRGYVDDIRITKGVGRYDQDTNIPIGSYPRYWSMPITNPGAESGSLSGWVNSGAGVRSSDPSPYEGSYYFTGGSSSVSSAYQDIAINSVIHPYVDKGTCRVKIDWMQASWGGSDEANIRLEFFDDNMVSIGSNPGPGLLAQTPSKTWVARTTDYVIVPTGTRTIRVKMEFKRNAGTNSDGYIDAIEGTLKWL